jgi:AhpD family alkylhydroperoxidase
MAPSYYEPSDLTRIPELVSKSPEVSAAFFAFEKEVYRQESLLSLQTKELIASVVAHVTGCPYCIDVHVRKYKTLGGSMEMLIEALMVAASTRAGAVLSHGTQAWKVFEEEQGAVEERKQAERAEAGKTTEDPSCYC